MDFAPPERAAHWLARLQDFLGRYVLPHNAAWQRSAAAGEYPPFIGDLKALAREEGLWNLCLPLLGDGEPGTRLEHLEYAPLAEAMGRIPWAAEVFNCNAPDSGNMLMLRTAWALDQPQPPAELRAWIAAAKVVAARLQVRVVDRAIQVFGAMGLSPDTPLAWLFTWGRALRIMGRTRRGAPAHGGARRTAARGGHAGALGGVVHHA